MAQFILWPLDGVVCLASSGSGVGDKSIRCYGSAGGGVELVLAPVVAG